MFRIEISFGQILWLIVIFLGLVAAINVFHWCVTKIRKSKMRKNKSTIATFSLTGLIRYSASPNSSYQKFMSQIKIVKEMEPKAAVLRINSPGGTTGASSEIYQAIKSLKNKGIKVVALMEDIAASGGLYVAMAADKIVATSGTITGSIGVIVKHMDISEVLRCLNIKVSSVKSGEYKDMLSPTKPLIRTGEVDSLIMSLIDDIHESFCSVIVESRELTLEKVREFADGRVMSAAEAKKRGLIDEIGGEGTAIDLAMRISGIEKGSEVIKPISMPMPFFQRLGLLPGVSTVVERLDNFLVEAELRGPLWLMER